MTPGPRGLAVAKTLLALRRDPLRTFVGLRARWGGVVRLPLGRRTFHLVAHHEGARHVLRDNAQNYTKDTWSYRLVREVLGDGLLTCEGETWKESRRLAQPAFHHAMLSTLASTIVDCTDSMVQRWPPRVLIDVGEEMGRLTLQIVSRAILGVDLGDDAGAVRQHLGAALKDIERRTARAIDWPLSWPLPRNRRFREHVRGLDSVVDRIVARRRAGTGMGADLTGMMLDARDARGLPLDDCQLRDGIKTILVAGHETTANLLTWMLALLGQQPDVERRVRDEVESTIGAGCPAAEHLATLSYTRQVVKEVLRLYPPIWLIERRAVEADGLSGWDLPAGAVVAVCHYALHRDPEVFADPERFDPERFTPTAEHQQPSCAYLPFGAGSRACIGGALTMMEAQLVVARVLQTLRLEPVASAVPEPLALLTLRPCTPVRMRVLGERRPGANLERPGAPPPRAVREGAPGAPRCRFASVDSTCAGTLAKRWIPDLPRWKAAWASWVAGVAATVPGSAASPVSLSVLTALTSLGAGLVAALVWAVDLVQGRCRLAWGK